MDEKMIRVIATAGAVEAEFQRRNAENKLNSYKQKLISAITFNDYDRFSTVLIQLASYIGIPFGFAYDLYEDFDSNKNLAYAFVNRLNGTYQKSENADTNMEEN